MIKNYKGILIFERPIVAQELYFHDGELVDVHDRTLSRRLYREEIEELNNKLKKIGTHDATTPKR